MLPLSLLKKCVLEIEALRPERLFLLLAIPFGFSLVLLTPPFQVPDEQVHFFRAYQISEGQMRGDRKGDEIGGELPASLHELREAFLGIRFRYEKKLDPEVLLSHLHQPLDPRQRMFVRFTPSATYSPPLYLPQAIGIAVARALGVGALGLLYWGRFFNLLAYVGLVRLALQILPIHRWVLALLALMPMAMVQASSTSVDAMANATTFLFFAAVLALALHPHGQTTFSPWWLVLVAGVVALCKGYPPLLGLCLLIPVERVGKKGAYALWIAAVGVAYVSALAAWFWLVSDRSQPADPGRIPPWTQLAQMMTHPHVFLRALWETWTSARVVGRIAWNFVGWLGWLDAPLPYRFALLYGGVLFAVALLDAPEETIRFARGQRLMAASVFVLCVGFVSTVMYVAHTPVQGGEVVSGIQGRYFISVMPLLLAAFANSRGARIFPKLKAGIIAVLLVSTAVTLLTLIERFYGKS